MPSCANELFNNQVLRGEEYGFSGIIVSDFGAIVGISDPLRHNFTSPDLTSAAGIRGGTDLDYGAFYTAHVPEDLAAGRLDTSDIDRALNRTLTQLISLGASLGCHLTLSPCYCHVNLKLIPRRSCGRGDAARVGGPG